MVYNKKYVLNTCSYKAQNLIRVELLRQEAAIDNTPPVPIAGTSSPIIIKPKDNGDNPLEYINGTECEVNLVSGNGVSALSFATENELEWRVDVYVNNNLYWRGFILPEGVSEPYDNLAYNIKLQATDRLGKAKDLPYSDNGTLYKGWATQKDVLCNALKLLGLELNVYIFVRTFEAQMDIGFCPLVQASINQSRFLDKSNNPYSLLDVIQSILIPYSARLIQSNGAWIIETLLEKNNAQNGFIFDFTGNAVSGVQINDQYDAGGVDSALAVLDDSHSITTQNSFKDTTSYYQFGFLASNSSNGDFNIFDTAINFFPGWTKQGGVNAGKSDETITAADGTVKRVGYALAIYANDNTNTKIVASDNISIRTNEKVTISFDVSCPGTLRSYTTTTTNGITNFIPIRSSLKLIIKDSNNQYLTTSGWKDGLNFYLVQVLNYNISNGKIYSVNFEIPARAADYVFSFGFQALIDTSIGFAAYETHFDNFVAQTAVAAALNPAIGLYNIQTQPKAVTTRGEPKVMIFGDEPDSLRLSQIKVNNNPTSSWHRYGIAETKSLLQIVTDSELRLNGSTKKLFDGDFATGFVISPTTKYTIRFLSGLFIFLSGEFDLVNEEYKLRLIELLTTSVNSTNTTVVDNGDFKTQSGASISTIGGVNLPPPQQISLTGYVQKWEEWTNTFKAKSYIIPNAVDPAPTFAGYQLYIDESGVGGTAPGGSGGTGSTTALSQLTDVALSGLLNGQILQYNASNGKWENKTAPTSGGATKTNLSQFINDLGNYGGFAVVAQLGSAAYNNTGDFIPRAPIYFGGTSIDTALATGIYRNENGAGGVYAYSPTLVLNSGDTGIQINGFYAGDNLQFRGFYSNGATFTPWRSIWHTGNFTPKTNLSQFINDLGNYGGFAISSQLGSNAFQSKTNLSQFINDLGNYGGFAISSQLGSNAFQSKTNLSQFINDLGNYGGWIYTDGITYAGLAGADSLYPYFRSAYTSEVIRLVRYDQLGQNAFQSKAYLSQFINDLPVETLQTVRNRNFAIYSTDNSDISYATAAFQVRESLAGNNSNYLAPRMAFHWGGIVASQIRLGLDGAFELINNPGTGWESIRLNNLTSYGTIIAANTILIPEKTNHNPIGTLWEIYVQN